MAPAFVQANQNTVNTPSPAALAFTSNNTLGNLLVVVGRSGSGAAGTISIADSQGNTWVIPIKDNWLTTNTFFMAYAANCKAGANTVTVTNSNGSSSLISFCIAEYSGVATSAPLDKSAVADTGSGAGTWTAANSGNVSPASNGELIVGGQGEGGSATATTAGSGYTQRASNASFSVSSLEDQVQSIAASIAATFTLNVASPGACGIMTFFATRAVAPVFSLASGIYALPQTVTITSATGGATIYYTTDGSTPTHSSPSISNGGTITVNSPQVVNAIAAFAGDTDSPVSTVQYGTPFNIWTPLGSVIPNASPSGDSFSNPNVIYDTNPVILTGHTNVFKMWCELQLGVSPTPGLYYFESLTGFPGSWVGYSGNPFLTGTALYPKVSKISGTYYLYIGTGPISAWTSTDGVTFTEQNANAIVVGGAGAWDSKEVYQLGIAGQIAGTWYAYFGALSTGGLTTDNYSGVATSTDLIHWTKSPSNPVILFSSGNWVFTPEINGAYYGFSQALYTTVNLPQFTAIFAITSTSPAGPWTEISSGGNPVPNYYLAAPEDFGEGTGGGATTTFQCGDPSIVFDGTNSWFFYTESTAGQATGTNAAIAYNTTLAQLVSTYIGVIGAPISGSPAINLDQLGSDPGTGTNANPIGGNWTQLASGGGFGPAQRLSNLIEAATVDTADSYWNALTWADDQWSQITVAACSASSFIGVILRANTSGVASAYRVIWTGTLGSPGTWHIQTLINGVATNIQSGTGVTVNVGDTIMGACNGPNIWFYWNGILLGTVVDSTFTSGAAGFMLLPVTSVSNAQISAWSGGSFRVAGDVGISGALGVAGAGATVSWTGTTSGNVTADGSGNYNTLEVLAPNGVYTITPAKAGYTFSPTSQLVTLSGTDVTGINFTATKNPSAGDGGSFNFAYNFG
jgi:hypothetical protein